MLLTFLFRLFLVCFVGFRLHFQVNMGHLEQWRSRQKIGLGKGGRCCCMCSNQKSLIRKYELNVCRQCFRENADNLGFSKNK
jgi:small subunit ribosomal protein S29e